MNMEKTSTEEEVLAVLKEILDKVNSGWNVHLDFNLTAPKETDKGEKEV